MELPEWQGIGYEAHKQWENALEARSYRKPIVQCTAEFRRKIAIENFTLNTVKVTAIGGIVVPVVAVSVAYGFIQAIDQFFKWTDPNFQLKALQGFHDFAKSDSLKLGAEIYGGIVGGVILIALLAYWVNKKMLDSTNLIEVADDEEDFRIESNDP